MTVCHAEVALKLCMGVVQQYRQLFSPEAVMLCHAEVALELCIGVVQQYR